MPWNTSTYRHPGGPMLLLCLKPAHLLENQSCSAPGRIDSIGIWSNARNLLIPCPTNVPFVKERKSWMLPKNLRSLLFIYWNKWFASAGWGFVCMCVSIIQRESVWRGRKSTEFICFLSPNTDTKSLMNGNKGESIMVQVVNTLSVLSHFLTIERERGW